MIKKSYFSEIKYMKNPEKDGISESNEYSFADGNRGLENESEEGLEYNYEMDKDNFDGEAIMHEDSIYACNESTENLIKFSKNKNLILISNNEIINSNWNGLDEDLRFSNIISGSSNIFLEKFYSSDEDYKLFLKNAEKNSFPFAKITIVDKRKIINSLSNYCYFKKLKNITSEINDDIWKIEIEKNNLDKIAFVEINENKFICDVAETHQDKVIGLQDKDKLDKNSGMLFTYSSPSDLYFHMGTVKFSIDILFIDENNKILKIYNNVKPRTLGTFGCANAKTVLEIPGGYCEDNKIKKGDFVTYSKLSFLNKNELKVALSPFNKSFSKVAKLSRYDFDLFRTAYAIDQKYLFPNKSGDYIVDNAKINWETLKLFHLDSLKYKNVKIASFDLSKIDSDSIEYPFADRIVIYGDLDDTIVNKIAISKLFDSMSLKNINFKILNTGSLDQKEVSKVMKDKFGAEKIFFNSGPLYKTAGFPVSEAAKQLAKKSDERLIICMKKLNNIINDLEQNISAYSAYKDRQDVISSSKAQFHQSVKKIIEKYELFLETVKSAIIILYKIKDASQTEALIDGLSQSSATLSESLNDILKMTDKVDDIEFFNLLSERTDRFKNLCKDTEFSIKGCREFIHSHILGVLVLS